MFCSLAGWVYSPLIFWNCKGSTIKDGGCGMVAMVTGNSWREQNAGKCSSDYCLGMNSVGMY